MFRSIDRATCRSREHSHSSCCHNKLNQSKVDLCLEQLIVSKTLGCVAKKIILRLIASIQQPAWRLGPKENEHKPEGPPWWRSDAFRRYRLSEPLTKEMKKSFSLLLKMVNISSLDICGGLTIQLLNTMYTSKPPFLLQCFVCFLISSGDAFSLPPVTTNAINNINIHTDINSRQHHYQHTTFIRYDHAQQNSRLYSTLSVPISNEKNNDIDDTATHGKYTAAHESDATHDVLLYIIQWRWVMWLYVL